MNLKKTSEVENSLQKLGLKEEIQKSKNRKIRAGKGTMRGRKYINRRGPLVVVAKDVDVSKAARNVPGVDLVEVKRLNAELLCPGIAPRRANIWTKEAVELLKKERLYM